MNAWYIAGGVLVLLIGFVLFSHYPDVRRYFKIRSM
jgi:hypothetical protein